MYTTPPMSKATPLVAPGHTRPVTHLSFSQIQDDGTYLLVSSCKDGNPMLREWTGDWIGTFLGHKGAVWSTKLSRDAARAATGSADFTAYVSSLSSPHNTSTHLFPRLINQEKYGTPTQVILYILFHTTTSSEASHYPQPLPIFLLAAKKKKCEYSILVDLMQSPLSFAILVPCLMKGSSKAWSGLENTLV